MENKTIQRGNADINYEVHGKGDITLLFVHGSYIDQSWWKNQVDFLKHDYTVITLDLPGHGISGRSRTDWSLQGFAEDVVAVIKDSQAEHVILIGHSMGADINLIAANLYPQPIAGMIAVENFKNAATPLPDEYQEQAAGIMKQMITSFADTNEQYARMALLTKDTPNAITQQVIKAYRDGYQPMGIALTPEIFNVFKIEKQLLPKLQWKLYLVNVNYMPTNEKALQQYTGSGYELLTMKGTCHFPMLENPKGLNRLLDEVIQEISVNILHGA